MKYFPDGDMMCLTANNFKNLQESPVTWIPLTDPLAVELQKESALRLKHLLYLWYFLQKLKALRNKVWPT